MGGPVEFSSHYDLLGQRMPPGEPGRDRQRGRSGGALVRPGPAARLAARRSGAAFLERHDVRVSDAAAVHAHLREFPARSAPAARRFGNRSRTDDEKDVPWGISECAYGALDANQIYQYRAFGVPGLALKPGLEDDLVVAPYATMLALLIDPAAAIENLKRLHALGFDGPMGLYESIDFNLENTRNGERGVVIYAYMAHHQGMSLAALDDVLHRDVMVERFHGDVRVRAMESLLFERIPIARPPAEAVEARSAPVRSATEEEPADRLWKEDTATPRVHLQGNGRYALMVTNSGGSHSRWNEFDITRWRSDTTLDRWGSFLYIRDLRSDSVWSAALQPLGAANATHQYNHGSLLRGSRRVHPASLWH